MPEQYEHMRDKFYREFIANGDDHDTAMAKAKEKAAKIWNSMHPDNPVGKGTKYE